METRGPYAIIGGFVLAAIVAAFTFVYWLNNSGGLGQRTNYAIRFDQPVSGLTTGSAVLFNGIRVGEVIGLRIGPDRPTSLVATFAVDPTTPVRSDTQIDIDYQGLTGVAAIALKGGAKEAPPLMGQNGQPPTLVAGPGVGQNLTQAAREALRHVDEVVTENRKSIQTAISGLSTFADMLGRNSERVEGLLGGLEKLTGGGAPKDGPKIYDLAAATAFPDFKKSLETQVAVPDPAAVLVFDSQKILLRTAEGTYSSIENAQWADNLPKLMQSRIVQSFENAKQLRMVSRPMDDLTADYRLTLEIRSFQISPDGTPTAVVEFAARLLGDGGKVVAAQMFKASVPAKSTQMADSVRALNDAFSQTAKDLVVWTVGAI